MAYPPARLGCIQYNLGGGVMYFAYFTYELQMHSVYRFAVVPYRPPRFSASYWSPVKVQFISNSYAHRNTLNEIVPDVLVRSPSSFASVSRKRTAGVRSSDDEFTQSDSTVRCSDASSDGFLEVRNRKMIRKHASQRQRHSGSPNNVELDSAPEASTVFTE
ncbi:hypothetical protein EVAR_26703_1 [Eumeta japonica]|uniref:Uncharacterized protein n=1 Tax=Eumeta variegata TaxID=151549 RepID=A0A4C1ZVD9_EUMVA|nr:hypothetical protein EVAR_26703_1 [Eumeta japonica]